MNELKKRLQVTSDGELFLEEIENEDESKEEIKIVKDNEALTELKARQIVPMLPNKEEYDFSIKKTF
jgi:hypothetical protein